MKDTSTPAVLLKDIRTRWGIYMKYLPVVVIDVNADRLHTVCLDNSFHPAGRCHSVKLMGDAVKLAPREEPS